MSIKDGIFAQVAGTVGRVFDTKNGRAFVIDVKDEKAQYPDKVTIWGAADNINEGDRVSAKGWFRDRIRKYQKQDGSEGVAVERSLNAPQIVGHEPAQPQAEPWTGDDSAPF